MALTTTTNRVDYGVTAATLFAVPFKFNTKSDLRVTRKSSAGVETDLVLDTDYTVLGAGSPTGGTVSYPAHNAADLGLTIRRVVPITQDLILQSQGAYFPETVENNFDKMVMIDQQQQETLDRAIVVPVGSSVTTTLPTPVATNILGWDATASFLTNYTPATLGIGGVSLADMADTGVGHGAQMMNYLQTGTGAVARTLDAKVKDLAVSPYEFGGTPGGVADATDALQKALNTLRLVDLGGKKWGYTSLTIPSGSPGFIGHSKQTSVSALVHLPGAGKIAWDGSTRVLNFWMERVYIEGSNDAAETCGLDLSGFSYSTFKDVYIRLFKQDAVYVDGVIDDGSPSHICKQFGDNLFLNCRFNNNYRDGIRLDSSVPAGNENAANTFVGCEFAGNACTGYNGLYEQANDLVSCVTQGNGAGHAGQVGYLDFYTNGSNVRFTGYQETNAKSMQFGPNSYGCEIKVKTSYPLWNAFVDNGTNNRFSVMGEKDAERQLFEDPTFLRWTSTTPVGIALSGAAALSPVADSNSPFGYDMQVTYNANFQGLILTLEDSAANLAGKWVTLLVEVDTSGITDSTVISRLYARMNGVLNTATGQFMSDTLPVTTSGQYKTLAFDVKFTGTPAGTADLIWYLNYSGAAATNVINIRSIRVVYGQTRKATPVFVDHTRPISVTTTTLSSKTTTVNNFRKYAGKTVFNSTAGKLYTALGTANTDKWRPSDNSGDITPA